MLEQLLAEIKSGTTTSPITLSERLNTTPRMVEAMLDTLEEMGFLTSISNDCQNTSCGACPVAGMCSSSNQKQPKIRILT
jgi:Mn-dependent DtxR family transcriptional regulator